MFTYKNLLPNVKRVQQKKSKNIVYLELSQWKYQNITKREFNTLITNLMILSVWGGDSCKYIFGSLEPCSFLWYGSSK